MGYIVKLVPENHILYVEENETVLDAALKQGYDFPYSCQNGVCGTCSGRLLQGTITYGGIEPIGLEEDEAAMGYALFCSAIPTSDLIIEIAGVTAPWQLPAKKLTYQISNVVELSPTIKQLLITPVDGAPLKYCAGQYILLGNSLGEFRPYTIANAPLGGQHLELHVKHTLDNSYSQQLLSDIENKLMLNIEGPFGQTMYHYVSDYPIIFLAGGTGFSQSKSLIEHIIALNPEQPIHLFWTAKTRDDLYFESLALEWQRTLAHFQFTPILSNPQEGWEGCSERIQQAVIKLYPDLSNYQIYAAGPQEMVFEALETFEKHHLNRDLMFSDAFELAK